MTIGTSKGAFYEDDFHYESAMWDPKYDPNDDAMVVTPPQVQQNKSLDNVEMGELGGIEVGMKGNEPPYSLNPMMDSLEGVLTMGGGNVSQFRSKPSNDNVKDLVNPSMSKVEQLARKLAETENGKGSWNRIGGGGQEHYWRDAEKALKTQRPKDYDQY